MDHDIIEELDDLISDIHGLIDEKAPAQEEEAPADLVLPEFLEEAMPEEAAAEEEIAPTEAPTEEESFHTQRWTDRQKVPKHVAKLQQNQEEAYAKWLQEQAEKAPEPPPEFPEEKVRRKKYETDAEDEPAEAEPKKKKKSTALWLCVFAVIVTLAVVICACWVMPTQPKAEIPGIRVSRSSTIVLAGTDDSYADTDMIMLLNLSGKQKSASLVSIPRDTLAQYDGDTVKLGQIYGLAGGGSEGVAALKEAVSHIVGFAPDGCMVLYPETLTSFVDLLGGVRMDLAAPVQLGKLTLHDGVQELDGRQALALMRHYDEEELTPDVTRMQLQRQFMVSVMEQCAARGFFKAPKLLDTMTAHTATDLSARNLLWLARVAVGLDLEEAYAVTLPGSYDAAGSFVPDTALVVQTVNAGLNPYVRAVSAEDLTAAQE